MLLKLMPNTVDSLTPILRVSPWIERGGTPKGKGSPGHHYLIIRIRLFILMMDPENDRTSLNCSGDRNRG